MRTWCAFHHRIKNFSCPQTKASSSWTLRKTYFCSYGWWPDQNNFEISLVTFVYWKTVWSKMRQSDFYDLVSQWVELCPIWNAQARARQKPQQMPGQGYDLWELDLRRNPWGELDLSHNPWGELDQELICDESWIKDAICDESWIWATKSEERRDCKRSLDTSHQGNHCRGPERTSQESCNKLTPLHAALRYCQLCYQGPIWAEAVAQKTSLRPPSSSSRSGMGSCHS